MALMHPSFLAALGAFTVSGGVLTETYGWGGKAARTSTGTYTITLDRNLSSNESNVQVTPQANGGAAAAQSFDVANTSQSVKTITTALSGAAADLNLAWAVFQTPRS